MVGRVLTALFLTGICSLAYGDSGQSGTVPEEALRAGERIYREGILPSGKPVEAITHGDIPVTGRMFTCANCHLRSGLGTIEGTIISPPTNGIELYTPLLAGPKMSDVNRQRLRREFRGVDRRPAYTDETLARAIWEGIDPTGRTFDPTMPKYFLDAGEMEILVHYLKNLSSALSPGVGNTEIRVATVITEGVSPVDRDAMLVPLKAYVRDRNSQSRHQEERARKAPFYRQESYTAYRRLALDVWELSGPPETWTGQLEDYYRKAPVFALLGGISEGTWAPIHTFCEKMGIPALFPVTDLPVISDSDWYTLYFSKGPFQEGETAARFLAREGFAQNGGKVLQVLRETEKGRACSEGFSSAWMKKRGPAPVTIQVPPGEAITAEQWRSWLTVHQGAALTLCLGLEEIRHLEGALADAGVPRPPFIMMSSTLLGHRPDLVPASLRGTVRLTYPFRLPEEEEQFNKLAVRWLKTRKIPVTNLRVQARMYFLGWMLTEALMHMKGDFYRDYFLDIVDMMRDQTYSITLYPRLSFGPGQRYASKGCYVVAVGEGESPPLIPKSGWVIH